MSIFDSNLEGEYYVHNWGWMAKALKDNIANANSTKDALENFMKQYENDLPSAVKQEISKAIKDGVFAAEIQKWIDSIPSNYLNVKDFGATGNGVSDDTASFQNALNSAYHKGCSVFVPAGYYRINRLQLPSYAEIWGVKGKSILAVADVTNSVIMMNQSDGNVVGYGATSGIYIHDLTFEGRYTVNGCIALGHARDCIIENCDFAHLEGWHFIEINGCKNVRVLKCNFKGYGITEGVISPNATEMVQLDAMIAENVFPFFGPYDGTYCSEILIDGCLFSNEENYGLEQVAKSPITGIGNHTYQVGCEPHDVIITNCIFEALNMGIGFSNVVGMNVENCKFLYVWNGIRQKGEGRFSTILIDGNSFYGYPGTVIPVGANGNARAVDIGMNNKASKNYITVTNNQIRHFAGMGIGISGTDIIISGNIINDIYDSTPLGRGISVGYEQSNVVCCDNVLFGSSWCDLYVQMHESNDIDIRNNRCEKIATSPNLTGTFSSCVFANNTTPNNIIRSNPDSKMTEYNNMIAGNLVKGIAT